MIRIRRGNARPPAPPNCWTNAMRTSFTLIPQTTTTQLAAPSKPPPPVTVIHSQRERHEVIAVATGSSDVRWTQVGGRPNKDKTTVRDATDREPRGGWMTPHSLPPSPPKSDWRDQTLATTVAGGGTHEFCQLVVEVAEVFGHGIKLRRIGRRLRSERTGLVR